ncbi:uncharacterized protein LOC118528468 [Halichoerus grypus]
MGGRGGAGEAGKGEGKREDGAACRGSRYCLLCSSLARGGRKPQPQPQVSPRCPVPPPHLSPLAPGGARLFGEGIVALGKGRGRKAGHWSFPSFRLLGLDFSASIIIMGPGLHLCCVPQKLPLVPSLMDVKEVAPGQENPDSNAREI